MTGYPTWNTATQTVLSETGPEFVHEPRNIFNRAPTLFFIFYIFTFHLHLSAVRVRGILLGSSRALGLRGYPLPDFEAGTMVWCVLLELVFMFLPYPVVSHLCRVPNVYSLLYLLLTKVGSLLSFDPCQEITYRLSSHSFPHANALYCTYIIYVREYLDAGMIKHTYVPHCGARGTKGTGTRIPGTTDCVHPTALSIGGARLQSKALAPV